MKRENIELNGIVLKTTPYSERDFLLEILSYEKGHVFVYAKNSTKANKNTAYAWPCSYSRFELASGNDGRLIYTGSTMLEYFPELRKDPVIMAEGQYFCEVSTFIPQNTDNPGAFLSLLLNSLYLLTGRSIKDLDPRKIKLSYEICFLHLSGLMPDASSCSSCGAKPEYWHFNEGFLCSDCAVKYSSEGRFYLNETMLKAIDHIIRSEGVSRYAFRMSDKSFDSLAFITELYLQHMLEAKLKTLELYNNLTAGNIYELSENT